MAHTIKVRQGGASDATDKDWTDQVPHMSVPQSMGEEPEGLWTAGMTFGQGRAGQFQFTIIDDANEIRTLTTGQIEPHNKVTVTEDAPGYACLLAVARIARKDVERGDHPFGDSRTWEATCDDANMDLRGMDLVDEWERPEETGTERLLALGAAFLQGDPRPSTVITVARWQASGESHLVKPNPDDGEATMPAQTYEVGTRLVDIIDDCAQTEGQDWGVVIHHGSGESHLCFMYTEEDDWDTYPSALAITDSAPDLDTEFPPIWDSGTSMEQDGQEVLTGIVSEYGDDRAHVVLVDPALVDQFDYWVEKITDATTTTFAGATSRAPHLLRGRAQEHVTHPVTIKIPADKVNLLAAGMSITIRSDASRHEESLGGTATRRIARLTWEPCAPEVGEVLGSYYAHMELDRPKKIARERRRARPGPKAPTTAADPEVLYAVNFDDDMAHTVDVWPSGTDLWPDNGGVIVASGGAETGAGYMNWPGAGTASYGSPQLLIPAPGGQIHVNMWGRNGGGFLDNPNYSIYFYDAGDAQVGSDYPITDGASHTSWQEFDADITVPATAVYAIFSKSDSGNSDYDNVTISVPGTVGDTTAPIGGDGDADAGSSTGTYAPIDHVHEHGDRSADTGSDHEVDQLHTAETDTDLRLAPDGAGGVEWGAAGAGAPDDANYLVGTASGDLSAEIVVGTTPGGELGGTWASPTVDSTHSGSTHSAATDTHIADAADAHDASAISVLDTGGNFTGTDVEAVLAELQGSISGGGIPATIFDAAGDIIVASAADTAARLAPGSEDDVLTIVSGVPAWAAPSGGGGGGKPYIWTPPGSADTLDDEFEDGSSQSGPTNGLDAKWTKRNLATGSWLKLDDDVAPSSLAFDIPASQSDDQSIYQTAPGGDFTIQAQLSRRWSTNSQFWGPFIVDSSGTGIGVIGWDSTQSMYIVNVDSWVFSSGATALPVAPSSTQDALVMTLRKVGTNYYGAVEFAAQNRLLGNDQRILTLRARAFTVAYAGFGRIYDDTAVLSRCVLDWFRRVE